MLSESWNYFWQGNQFSLGEYHGKCDGELRIDGLLQFVGREIIGKITIVQFKIVEVDNLIRVCINLAFISKSFSYSNTSWKTFMGLSSKATTFFAWKHIAKRRRMIWIEGIIVHEARERLSCGTNSTESQNFRKLSEQWQSPIQLTQFDIHWYLTLKYLQRVAEKFLESNT